MNEPTTEQVIELWKGLGWEFTPDGKFFRVYKDASGWGYVSKLVESTLSLDYLFLNAVPKLDEGYTFTFYQLTNGWMVEIHESSPIAVGEGQAETPALALFWAIMEVIHQEEGGK